MYLEVCSECFVTRRRVEFATRPVNVVFVVDYVRLGQVILRIVRFSPVSIIPLVLNMFTSLSSTRGTMNPLVAGDLRYTWSGPFAIITIKYDRNHSCFVRIDKCLSIYGTRTIGGTRIK